MNSNRLSNFTVHKHGLVLGAFALLVTTLLALTQMATKGSIELNEKIQREKTLAEVLPAQWYDHPIDQHKIELNDAANNTKRICYVAKLNGVPTGAIIAATATDGYSGNIDLLIGILKDGTISGVRVTKHSETPGLGDAIEIKRSQWIKSFDGKSLVSPIESGWATRKNNGDFDQFTGATITPRAVINEVRNTLVFFNTVKSPTIFTMNETLKNPAAENNSISVAASNPTTQNLSGSNLWSGLWSNNPALVQLLGLCPLLAVSNTAINGLSLGIATAFTVLLSNISVSACRNFILPDIRIPIYVILISGIVTMVSLLMNAFAHDIYLQLGIFIPLIITNCAILARAESFASKNTVFDSAIDGIATGIGFALVLVALGAARELIGNGTLFSDAHLLFGTVSSAPLIDLGEQYRGLLIAILPPGAFILFGLLLVLKNLSSNQ